MPKNQDFDQDVRLYGKGARPDVDKELLPQSGPGYYYDAENMRPDGETGSKGGMEKAGYAELVQDPITGGDSNFYCMGAIVVSGKKVAFYAHIAGSSDPRIYVDGQKVAQHEDLPIVYQQNFQLDKNDNCSGGEVFIFSESEPIILNVGDMVDSLASGSQKYFDDFNYEAYSVNVFKPLDIPIFREITQVGSGGLPPGSYRYSIRYVTDDPDNPDLIVAYSQWSPYTPYIHVPKNIGPRGNIFLHNATIGGEPDPDGESTLGITIRFRVTNVLNFGIIEVKRQRAIAGLAADITPPEELIARIPIQNGSIGIIDFIDPTDNTDEEDLSVDNSIENNLSYINSAKTGRYINKKLVLMNINAPSRDEPITLTSSNGEKIYPVIKKIGKEGMKDAYNQVYYKPYMHGEKFSFAPVLFDGVGSYGFAREDDDLKNFQIPNRRDPASTNTQAVSSGNMPIAACTDHTVGFCHEIFDMTDAIFRTDNCSFKNVFDFNQVGNTVGRLTTETNKHQNVGPLGPCPDATQMPGVTEVSVLGVKRIHLTYLPFTPKFSGDEDFSGLNYRVNPEAWNNNTAKVAFFPKIFEPNFYSTGVAIDGITNLPSWARAFTIARSAPAGRVIAQGIGVYRMSETDVSTSSAKGKKALTGFWFHSPDIQSGVVSDALMDSIQSTPEAFKIQLVSPLGFTSEVFGFENLTAGTNDRIIDMLTHASVLFDDGRINNGEHAAMGINRFVGFGKYRNFTQSSVYQGANGGNIEFGIRSITPISEGRGSYFSIEVENTDGTNVNVYSKEDTGRTSTSATYFDNNDVRDWHEPFYMINIIQDKDVPDKTINEYVPTGHYQKIDSIIGGGDGTPNQEFELVDERWEDCIPALDSGDPGASDNVYVTIQDEDLNKEKWVNVTFKTGSEKITINNDIVANGYWDPGDGTQVKGMYTHETSSNQRDHTIIFDQFSFFPPSESYVIVSYDNTRPIKVFGGNVSLGYSLFCPLDKTADGSFSNVGAQFEIGVGFPYHKYEVNARYMIIARANGPTNFIQDVASATTAIYRQWMVMYLSESVTPLHLPHGSQTYPHVNYIIRPNRFGGGGAGSNNIFSEEYLGDYGEGEDDIWEKGGFRFNPIYNIDYRKDPPVQYFSKPKVGFSNQDEFCTRVWASQARQTNAQNSPSLRTFLATDYIDIDDDQGEIIMAWDAMSGGKGENLYAITEHGICLLPTSKSILTDLNTDEIGLFAQDKFILAQYWIDKSIGIPSGFERSAIKESIGTKTDSGKIQREGLIFMNKNSVYRLVDNSLTDILQDKYSSILRPIIDTVPEGYSMKLSAGYDVRHDEYYLTIDGSKTYVFSQDMNEWIGKMNFQFEAYMSDGRDTFGEKAIKTHKINSGTTNPVTGTVPVSWVIQVSSMDFTRAKDYPAISVNCNYEPAKIEFLEEDKDDPTLLSVIGIINKGDFREYDGYEQDVPRRSDNTERIQGRLLIYKIYHNGVTSGVPSVVTNERFRLKSSKVSNKNLN